MNDKSQLRDWMLKHTSMDYTVQFENVFDKSYLEGILEQFKEKIEAFPEPEEKTPSFGFELDLPVMEIF